MPTVLITVDSLRADHLGQYGYERDTMPVLDRMLADGTRFDQAFSNGPYTRVSIPSFHTSRYLAYGNLDAFPTIASVLGSAGITTAAIGTQTGIDMVRGAFGFDEMVDLGRDDFERGERRSAAECARFRIDGIATRISEWLQRRRMNKLYDVLQRPYNAIIGESPVTIQGYISAERVTDRAISWIESETSSNDGSRTESDFFLWLHYMEAHRPYGIHDETPAYLDGPCDDETIRELLKRAGTSPEEVSERDRQLMIDLYDSDLRYCSRHLERLVDALEDAGCWADTNVLFSSDHGEEFGEHGYFFHRNYPYDELIHVPLIVKPAASPVVDTVQTQRELLDLAPTICSFHDVDASDASFLGTPLYEGDDRTVLALGQPGMDEPAVTVRTDGWKYVHTEVDQLLYDLDADPGEQDDVVDENPRVAARLRRAVPDRLFGRDTKAPRPPEDDVDREQLAALGYMELREEDST